MTQKEVDYLTWAGLISGFIAEIISAAVLGFLGNPMVKVATAVLVVGGIVAGVITEKTVKTCWPLIALLTILLAIPVFGSIALFVTGRGPAGVALLVFSLCSLGACVVGFLFQA